jgi:TOMM system kinase/cyclase fusion protein
MTTTQQTQCDIKERFQSLEYCLLNKIGQGGFGSVYRAKKLSTGQYVAIKFLNLNADLDELKRNRYINRFHREAELSCLLQHQNIVRLLDKGVCDQGLIYAIFEYVEGESLKEVLQKESLPPQLVADLMGQVLDALSHAHEKGVIHRDLKPANIMLVKTGTGFHIKVLDFGIATLTHEARYQDYQTITLTHETLGTPSYCAPEQLRGEPPTIKSDLYVWGLVFIECLTGKPAISGSSLASVFHQQLSQSSINLPLWIASHPVAALLRRVLHKKSQDRISKVLDIHSELGKINFSTMVVPKSSSDFHTLIAPIPALDQTLLNTGSHYFTVVSERKPISVLCVSLSIQAVSDSVVDLEVIETLHRDQKIMCVDLATRYGAFHTGTLGDTLLFYFGYPQVSDNDCRLCVRTALEISSSLTKRNALLRDSQNIEINAKMGLHSGLATHYSGLPPEGEVISIAMELTRTACVGQVYCTESSKRLLDSYIDFIFNEERIMGVNRQSTSIYQVLGERVYESIGLLKSGRSNANIVGRKKEIKKIKTILACSDGHSIIHLFGEPGIGKSRLLFELKENITTEEFLFCQCLPEQKFSGLFPIINLMKIRFSLGSLPMDQAAKKIMKLYKLAGGMNESIAIPLLCSWLNISVPNDIPLVITPAEKNKDILFESIHILLFSHRSENKRIIFVLEDMHWIDPTTLEFILYLMNQKCFIGNKSVFLSTSRQAFPSYLSQHYCVSIKLLRLDNDESNRLIANIFDRKSISFNVMQAVNSRADGIPLYIEELVNMFKDQNLTRYLNGTIDFIDQESITDIPETLLESLQQKLDGLINAKESAQLASAIGRKFDYKLLIMASAKSEDQVQSDLDELLTQEIIYQQRHVSGDSYFFKHALVRDAAYKGMSKADLVKAHLNIAQCMNSDVTKKSNHTPTMIADHYSKGNDYIEAVKFGKQAIYELGKISSNKQALEYAKIVNVWLSKLENKQLKIELKIQLNNIILPIKAMYQGWGDPEVKLLAEDNLQNLYEIENSHNGSFKEDELRAYQHKSKWIIFISNHLQSNRVEATEQGEALLKEALNEHNRQNELVVRSILGQIYYFNAQFNKAKSNFKRSIDIYDNKLDQFLYIEYVIDPYLFSSGNLLLIESLMGNAALANHYSELCMNYARQTENIANIATAYTFGCLKYFMFSDKNGLREWAESAIEKYGDKLKSSWIYDFFYMLYEWSKNDFFRSQKIVKEQIDKGQSGILSWYEPSLADTYILNEMFDEAITLMLSSIKRAEDSGEDCILPLSYRYLAKAQYLKSGFLCETSTENFEKAILLARSSGTYGLESNAIIEYIKCINEDNNKNKVLFEIKTMDKRLALLRALRLEEVFTMI